MTIHKEIAREIINRVDKKVKLASSTRINGVRTKFYVSHNSNLFRMAIWKQSPKARRFDSILAGLIPRELRDAEEVDTVCVCRIQIMKRGISIERIAGPHYSSKHDSSFEQTFVQYSRPDFFDIFNKEISTILHKNRNKR